MGDTYCTDADMEKIRPNILQLGVTDWSNERDEAYSLINRIITARWYNKAAEIMGVDPRATAFTPANVESGTFQRLETYKALELAYLKLMKGGAEEDGFERQMEMFRKRFNDELLLILDIGINYDWDNNELVDDDEKFIRSPRRLMRA